MWAAVGAKMTIQEVEDATWTTDLENTRNFDMVIDEKTFGLYDPDPSVLLSSEEAQEGGRNAGDYRNATVDKLLNEAIGTVDQKKRAAAYVKLQDYVMEQLPLLPIVSGKDVWAINKRVQGFKVGPKSEFINWYWMKDVWVSGGE